MMTDIERLIEAVEAGAVGWNAVASLCEAAGIGLPQSQAAASAYTGFLDAAHALHKALLPGWEWNIDAGDGAYVENRGDFGDMISADIPNNPARSWLLAILRAKAAQE